MTRFLAIIGGVTVAWVAYTWVQIEAERRAQQRVPADRLRGPRRTPAG